MPDFKFGIIGKTFLGFQAEKMRENRWTKKSTDMLI